ncbi:MAG: sel1 repeat family protein [Desulfobacteraceae bacterium]|jgi:TPR repeat protein|nr:sel1 repeat family protein [Desulfobacteraceae bacterium]MBT6050574.1 sel1 repeat family protein [Candidatus Scalindua sp.]
MLKYIVILLCSLLSVNTWAMDCVQINKYAEAYGKIIGTYSIALSLTELCGEDPAYKKEAEETARNYLNANQAILNNIRKESDILIVKCGREKERLKLDDAMVQIRSMARSEARKQIVNDESCASILSNLRRGVVDLKNQHHNEITFIMDSSNDNRYNDVAETAVIVLADPITKGNAAYNKEDYSTALKIYLSEAEKGSSDAENNLGLMYSRGHGVKQDYQKAAKYFQFAASMGCPEAQTSLGIMYSKGIGVNQDLEKALELYRLAAAQNYPNAQYNLGVMYRKGKWVAQSNQEAVSWYKMAASQGLSDAQNNLGFMYINGYGIQQDIEKAFFLFKKAASQGNAKSQYTLGLMHKEGKGMPQDFVKAYMWFRLAEKVASMSADPLKPGSMTTAQLSLVQKNIKVIIKMMTTEQITKAESLVKTYKY